MSLLPNTPYSSNSDTTGLPTPYDLPHGVANGLTWTSGLNGTYINNYPVPGITQNSTVQATIAVSLLQGASNFNDAINCWLVSCSCYNGGIQFVVAGNPADPTHFPIVWAITQL